MKKHLVELRDFYNGLKEIDNKTLYRTVRLLNRLSDREAVRREGKYERFTFNKDKIRDFFGKFNLSSNLENLDLIRELNNIAKLSLTFGKNILTKDYPSKSGIIEPKEFDNCSLDAFNNFIISLPHSGIKYYLKASGEATVISTSPNPSPDNITTLFNGRGVILGRPLAMNRFLGSTSSISLFEIGAFLGKDVKACDAEMISRAGILLIRAKDRILAFERKTSNEILIEDYNIGDVPGLRTVNFDVDDTALT